MRRSGVRSSPAPPVPDTKLAPGRLNDLGYRSIADVQFDVNRVGIICANDHKRTLKVIRINAHMDRKITSYSPRYRLR